MKSKLNDAGLIAEAYSQISPKLSAEEIKANQLKKIDTIIDSAVNSDGEIQEEMLGALAGGIGAAARGAGTAARAVGKAATSEVAKKVYRAAGKGVKKAAETVGGAAIGAASGAAGGVGKAVSGIAQGAIEGTVGAVQGAVDGATGGIGKAARGAGENIAGSFAGDEELEDNENMPRINYADDSEMKMALAELYKIEKYAFALSLMMKELPALEGWTAAKITKAADYLGSVFHKLDYDFASGEHSSMFNIGHEDVKECGCGVEDSECTHS